MAFIGKDWRDPGSEYLKIKGDGSWESKKICRIRMFETLNETFLRRAFRQSISSSENTNKVIEDSPESFGKYGFYQPCIKMKSLSTKESKIITSITDVFQSLDFLIAVKDIRRFGYICRVLEILFFDKLHNLSGRTQIYLMRLLKEVFNQVILSCNNTDKLRQLLKNCEETLKNFKYNHVGSSQLWTNHMTTVHEMQTELDKLNLVQKDPDLLPNMRQLDELPPECLWKILVHLTSPQDLQVVSQTNGTLQQIANDKLLWKQLVLYHFSKEQLTSILLTSHTIDDCNWQYVYKRLLKKYGDHHYYPTKLAKCNKCSSLFWPIFGHPCNNEEESYLLLSPEDFINLFPI